MVSISIFACLGLVSQAFAACLRSSLTNATTTYLAAAVAGSPSLLPLASNLTYIENNVTLDITKGILSTPIIIDFNRSLHDTTQCIAMLEISAASNKLPYVLQVHLTLTLNKLTKIETLASSAGDWAFDAKGQLSWTKQEKWDPISAAKRDARAVIQAVGDAYLDSWGDASVRPPFGTPCSRLEGGSYTGGTNPTTNTCKMPQFPQPFRVGNRRYVIDEEGGAMSIFNDFPFIDKTKPDGTPSGNMFRVEGGMIKYIHEVTICATKNCGR